MVLAPPPVDDTAELEPVLGFPAEAEPVRGPARRPDARVVAAGAAALVLVGGAAVLGLRATGAGEAATTPQGAPAAAAVVPVDAADVRVEASTTQQPDNGITYDAANTLDGRPETAWNSDGQGAGATLVYTFAQPVDLRTITVLNGYQKVRAGSSGRVDLFALNERVRAFTVVTDAGSATWTLRDARAPQTLTHAFGRTRTVKLRVDAVYPSRKYTDLAVSEVRFGEAGS